MVEVALALLVISLGLSTVLTLFPAGLKATREAEAANDVAEAAEYVFGYLQATILDKGIAPSDDKDGVHVRAANSDPINDKVQAAPSDLSRLEWVSTNGVYLYRKTIDVNSGYAEDFSCVVQIFSAKDGTKADAPSSTFAYFPSLAGTDSIQESTDHSPRKTYNFNSWSNPSSVPSTPTKIFRAFDVELSYPAAVPRSQRVIRTYRMVVLSELSR